MKKTTLYILSLLACVAPFFSACSDDTIDGPSIFAETDTVASTPEAQAFDRWIKTNLTDPYNIRFIYRYVDAETNNTYNVVPPDFDHAQAAAMLIKHTWIDAYAEVAGDEFVKRYTPRIYQLIGSNEFNSSGSRVMGTAEGGVKITLFGINLFDLDDPLIDVDSPTPNRSENPIDLNYNVFQTIHHEFCHILTQQKNYSTDFRTVSAGNYHTADWINVGDDEAPGMGFTTNYASEEYNEDFAETYANYVTKSDSGWNALIEMAGGYAEDENGELVPQGGAAAILQKLDIVRNYFESQWGIDIDKLRSVVLRRIEEARTMDLHTLK